MLPLQDHAEDLADSPSNDGEKEEQDNESDECDDEDDDEAEGNYCPTVDNEYALESYIRKSISQFEEVSLTVANGCEDRQQLAELLLSILKNLRVILSHVRSSKELASSKQRL